jgi:hypothetical protein
MLTFCPRCASERWVCKAHQHRPWGGEHGCSCGAAGSPCPICNEVAPGEKPALPPGFQVEAEADFTPLLDDDVEREEVQEAFRRLIEAARRKH